jgi:cbb3-type cytochrome oxidase subunit 3
MISEFLKNQNDMSIFPIISLIIFFLFFIGSVIWTFTRKKQYLIHMENLPLENNDINNSEMKNEIVK